MLFTINYYIIYLRGNTQKKRKEEYHMKQKTVISIVQNASKTGITALITLPHATTHAVDILTDDLIDVGYDGDRINTRAIAQLIQNKIETAIEADGEPIADAIADALYNAGTVHIDDKPCADDCNRDDCEWVWVHADAHGNHYYHSIDYAVTHVNCTVTA